MPLDKYFWSVSKISKRGGETCIWKGEYSIKKLRRLLCFAFENDDFWHKTQPTWHEYPFNQNEICFIQTNKPEVTYTRRLCLRTRFIKIYDAILIRKLWPCWINFSALQSEFHKTQFLPLIGTWITPTLYVFKISVCDIGRGWDFEELTRHM
jgi:hypothetical protein